jgi:hypothetical protein
MTAADTVTSDLGPIRLLRTWRHPRAGQGNRAAELRHDLGRRFATYKPVPLL